MGNQLSIYEKIDLGMYSMNCEVECLNQILSIINKIPINEQIDSVKYLLYNFNNSRPLYVNYYIKYDEIGNKSIKLYEDNNSHIPIAKYDGFLIRSRYYHATIAEHIQLCNIGINKLYRTEMILHPMIISILHTVIKELKLPRMFGWQYETDYFKP